MTACCGHRHGARLREATPSRRLSPSKVSLSTRSQVRAIQKMSDQVHSAMLWREDRLVSELLRQYDEFTDALNRDVADLYARTFRGDKPTLEQWNRANADAKAQRLIADHLQRLNVHVDTGLEDTLSTFWREAYNRNAWLLDNASPLNVDISYDLPPDPFVRAFVGSPWKGAMFSERIGVINNAMARDIQTQLTASVLAGEGPYEASQKIRDLVGVDEGERLATRPRASRAKWRADMIARTEMIRASRQAQRYVFEQNRDLIEDLEWVAFEGDTRTCAVCEFLNGKTREQVERAGYEFDEPAHPNCRCTRLPRMKSWKDLLGPNAKGMPEGPDDAMRTPTDTGGFAWSTPQQYDTWANKYLTPRERG